MKLLRPIILAAVMALAGGCMPPIGAISLISLGQLMAFDMSRDESFQRLDALAWDGDNRQLFMAFANQDGAALYRWDQTQGLRRIRPLPESVSRLDVQDGKLLLGTRVGTLATTSLEAPLRWIPNAQAPMAAGNAVWDNGQILMSAPDKVTCGVFRGVWRGDVSWSKPERLYGDDLPWNALRSPSGKRLAYSYLANPSDTWPQIRVHTSEGDPASFDPKVDRNRWAWLNDGTLLMWRRDFRPLPTAATTLDVTTGKTADLDTAPIFEPSFGITAVVPAPSGNTVAWLVERTPPDVRTNNTYKKDQRVVLTRPDGTEAKQILSLRDFPPGSRFYPPYDDSITVYPPTTSQPQEGGR